MGWQIWAIRFVISMIGATVLAFVVSFRVADYVLEAHNSTLSDTLGGLQGSVDRLNDSMNENTAAVLRLHELMSELRADSRQQGEVLVTLKSDVAQLQKAVQNSGIDIRIGAPDNGRPLPWSSIRDAAGLEEGEPLYLELKSE